MGFPGPPFGRVMPTPPGDLADDRSANRISSFGAHRNYSSVISICCGGSSSINNGLKYSSILKHKKPREEKRLTITKTKAIETSEWTYDNV